jgi:hypothetical protein
MGQEKAVHQGLIEVTDKLATLGLTVKILTDSILAGEAARDMCTANDPQTAGGYDAWARATKSLREQLTSQGWKRSDDGGLPVVVSPSGDLAVTVATGDENTGRPESSPRTKYAKGGTTILLVTRNRMQTDFFGLNQEQVIVPDPACKTWFLLRIRNGESVQAELSLPAAIGDDGRVEEWLERIILPTISLKPGGGIVGQDLPDSGDERGIEIDVPVRRRSRQ